MLRLVGPAPIARPRCSVHLRSASSEHLSSNSHYHKPCIGLGNLPGELHAAGPMARRGSALELHAGPLAGRQPAQCSAPRNSSLGSDDVLVGVLRLAPPNAMVPCGVCLVLLLTPRHPAVRRVG